MFTISDNTPSTGCIQWSNMHMQYLGVTYTIQNGYTNYPYVYWSHSTPTQLVVSNTLPTNLTDADCLLFLNKSGIHLTVPTATILDGDLLVPGSIMANALAANSVTSNAIAAGAITAGKIAADAVTSNSISTGAITADSLAANCIGAAAIAANAITSDKIVSSAITTDKLAASAVTANKIAANTITADNIAANTITANELAAGTITSDSACIASLKADWITAGTLDASKITVTNLDASKINTGTLNGISITGSTITGSTITAKDTLNVNGSTGWAQLEFTSYWNKKGYIYANDQRGLNFQGDVSAMFQLPISPSCGFNASYIWTGTIPAGGTITITHNLGYYPIHSEDGTVGNINVTLQYVSTTQIKACNSTGNAWTGNIRLF